MSRIFSNSTIVEEYEAHSPIFFLGSSFQESLEDFHGDVQSKLRRLRSIVDRLELFEPNKISEADIDSEKVLNRSVPNSIVLSPSKSNRRIAIVAAMREELDYLMEDTEFHWSKSETLGGGITVKRAQTQHGFELLAAYASGMGLTEAAILTTLIIRECQPSLVIMIGICGGFKERGVNIGDIIVADKAFHYQFGSYKDGRIHRELKTAEIEDSLMRSMHEHFTSKVLANIQSSVPRGFTRPDNILKAHFGPIASADLVVKEEGKLLEAKDAERKVIAIDMESYAFLRAAKLLKTDAIVIKSTTDFADVNKGQHDHYREYCKVVSTFSILELIREPRFIQNYTKIPD